MRLQTDGSLPGVRGFIMWRQAIERGEQTRRRVIRNVVTAALCNVLNTARLRQRANKKKQRKLRTPRHQCTMELGVGEAEQTSECQVALPTLAVQDSGSAATEECVVCFALLGSKRSLFTCGHAVCCAVCSVEMEVCPMCRQSVSIVMSIFV